MYGVILERRAEMPARPEYHLTIKEMPPDQRPRERLISFGPGVLSNAEILAILLGTGTGDETSIELAQRILTLHGGISFLAEASVEELISIRGIGPAKTAQIKAAIELGKRLASTTRWERPAIKSPLDVFHLMGEDMRYLDRENFNAILLNTKNYVLGIDTISVGSLNASLVHPRELFKRAILKSAAAIILVHNHPSGDPQPSEEDKQVTRKMVEAGGIIGIDVLDHIIIGDGRFASLREQGFM
jgi:DNA repair protein RadC